MEALIVGRSLTGAWALPFLLSRAGFCVDVVTASRSMRLSRFARDIHLVRPGASVAQFAHEHVHARAKPYDWVIATDDPTLTALAELERRQDTPSNLLPLLPGKSRDHLHSKIGLSRALSAAGIRTPAFRVAHHCDEAISAAREIGYPVIAKVDASAGGSGVHECRGDAEIVALRHLFARPLLIQKKIEGNELDLSAIYLEGELVHFTYAIVERTTRRFGPSVVRTYYPSSLVERAVFDELSALGRALGANGFVTISCMDAADGSGRSYIEADMRPNVWVDFSVFYGEDAAPRIRNWFSRRIRLTKENAAADAAARAAVTIPYFLRLNLFELLVNRYAVWKFIPFADARLVRKLLVVKALAGIIALRKWTAPQTLRTALRRRSWRPAAIR